MKTIYFILTNSGTWGKGKDFPSAYKNAKANAKTELAVCTMIFKREVTPEQLDTIYKCYAVSGMGSVVRCDDCTAEEKTLLDSSYVAHDWIHNIKISLTK